eukprot:CAMPEP_0185818254 /NCGR_PEP_ID=MMETSP1322-20130828/20347_1 /TAXON_ID=265543 /ORGANISM="Minutocellus polymorphus, Strain RCC2270" /LENGTH=40 /DNA_ID= /DNA_START= /DNA_END= /DNA_ORIENTATION=
MNEEFSEEPVEWFVNQMGFESLAGLQSTLDGPHTGAVRRR